MPHRATSPADGRRPRRADVVAAQKVRRGTGADSVISVSTFPKYGHLFTLGHANRMRGAGERGHGLPRRTGDYLNQVGSTCWRRATEDRAYAYVMAAGRSLDNRNARGTRGGQGMLGRPGAFDHVGDRQEGDGTGMTSHQILEFPVLQYSVGSVKAALFSDLYVER